MTVQPDAEAPAQAEVPQSRRELNVPSKRRLRLRRARVPFALASGAVAFGLAVVVLAWASHAPPTLKLEMSFSRSACCSMQVWVNGTTLDDITVLPIAAGRTAVYSVPIWKSRVLGLRMPLGEVSGSSVLVRRIWIQRGSDRVDELRAERRGGVTAYGANVQSRSDGIQVTAQGRHPFVYIPVSLNTHEGPVRLFLAKLVAQPLQPFVALAVLGVLVTILFAVATRVDAVLILSLAAVFLMIRFLPWLLGHIAFHDDVSRAVSYSSYRNIPKARERAIFDTSVAIAFVVPVCGALLARRIRRTDSVSATPSVHRPLPRAMVGAMLAVPAVVAGLVGVPHLHPLAARGRADLYVPSWDMNNLTFWHYLIQAKHLAPLKDFFWPYSFQWLFDLAIPWGEVWSYVGYLSFWIFLAIGTYTALARFFGGGPLVRRWAFLSGLWVSALLAGYVPFESRYIAPLAVTLLFAGIDARQRPVSWRRLVFGLALFELTLFEVAQALYALVPIAFLLLAELVFGVGRNRRAVFTWLATSAATLAVPLAAATLVYAAVGELGGLIDYYAAINALTANYAWPSHVAHWVREPDDLASFVFWAVPLTIALGAFGMAVRRRGLRQAYAIVVALGLLGVMVMQKQVLRAPIEAQIWPAATFGLAFWAAVETSLHPNRRTATVAVFAGFGAALIAVSGGYHHGVATATHGPARLVRSLRALASDRDAFAADARTQFAPARFANFHEYQSLVAALRRDPALRAGGRLWVLGDDSPIVMMLQRSWPYYFSELYDAGPISFQRKVISRLERMPPARVVWNFNPDAVVFDTVPYPVRDPLLYQWTVEHYVPLQEVGQIAILRPRAAHEAIPLQWWRGRIGSTLDLAAIPEVARVSGERCASTCGGVYAVATFRGDQPHPRRAQFEVRINGVSFTVAFDVTGADRYVVPLHRLWFWLPGENASRSVIAKPADGMTLTIVRRSTSDGVLY